MTLTLLQIAAFDAIHGAAPRLLDTPREMRQSLEAGGYVSLRLGDVGEDWTKPAERRLLKKALKQAEKAGFRIYPTDKGLGLELPIKP